VIIGVAIRRFIKLKVEIQAIPRHISVDVGLQFLITLLIIAVLTLAFVILNERHKVENAELFLIGALQLTLCGFSMFVVLAIAWAEEISVSQPRHLSGRYHPLSVSATTALVEKLCERIQDLNDRLTASTGEMPSPAEASETPSPLDKSRLDGAIHNFLMVSEHLRLKLSDLRSDEGAADKPTAEADVQSEQT
jgi:hypothetical protein